MKKLYIETYGCQMNVADSETVASVMKMAGYDICEQESEADAIFLNTCSVRDNAEQKIINRLNALHAERAKGKACWSTIMQMSWPVPMPIYACPILLHRLKTAEKPWMWNFR